MMAAGVQVKTACDNMQLCTGLESGIECATHAVGRRLKERASQRRSVEEARRPDEEEDEDKAAREESLTVEIEGMEEVVE